MGRSEVGGQKVWSRGGPAMRSAGQWFGGSRGQGPWPISFDHRVRSPEVKLKTGHKAQETAAVMDCGKPGAPVSHSFMVTANLSMSPSLVIEQTNELQVISMTPEAI